MKGVIFKKVKTIDKNAQAFQAVVFAILQP